jgi:hypothetical protein
MGRSEDIIERAFSEEERAELLKNNKYFNLGNDFDPINILADGKLPEFKSQGDKFRCVMAVSNFVRERNSIDGIAEDLVKFLKALELDMLVLFTKQQTLKVLNELANNSQLAQAISRVVSDE